MNERCPTCGWVTLRHPDADKPLIASLAEDLAEVRLVAMVAGQIGAAMIALHGIPQEAARRAFVAESLTLARLIVEGAR